jgi:hypothetical protein
LDSRVPLVVRGGIFDNIDEGRERRIDQIWYRDRQTQGPSAMVIPDEFWDRLFVIRCVGMSRLFTGGRIKGRGCGTA